MVALRGCEARTARVSDPWLKALSQWSLRDQ